MQFNLFIANFEDGDFVGLPAGMPGKRIVNETLNYI
jgi:hypothetical protein